MSIEGTANTEYASLSGKIRTFVIDKSLTISGACADAKATGDRLNSLIDDAETAAVEAATKTANEKLANFLDSTLTKSDKAAQAAAVGARLDKLDAQHTIEKIAEMTVSEDIPHSDHEYVKFYIELPEMLSSYPILMIRVINFKCHPDYAPNGGGYCYINAVESLTSTTSLMRLIHVSGYGQKVGLNQVNVFYPFEVGSGNLCVGDGDGSRLSAITDTKYLYVESPIGGIAAGSHIEIWGAVK